MRVIRQEESGLWVAYQGDCVEVVKAIPEASIDFSIFSPPFASLYTYSASDRDMGNCADQDEFATHFKFLIPELFRVTKPGRLLSFHCMNLPTSKERDGYIGIRADALARSSRHSRTTGWRGTLPFASRGDLEEQTRGARHAADEGARPSAQDDPKGFGHVAPGHPRLPGDHAQAGTGSTRTRSPCDTAEQFPVSLWRDASATPRRVWNSSMQIRQTRSRSGSAREHGSRFPP